MSRTYREGTGVGWGDAQLVSLKLAATWEGGGERHAPTALPPHKTPVTTE